MPVKELPRTASVEAGSQHQFVTLYDVLYQFYRVEPFMEMSNEKLGINYLLNLISP
mgnify:CR=1 FL=1